MHYFTHSVLKYSHKGDSLCNNKDAGDEQNKFIVS